MKEDTQYMNVEQSATAANGVDIEDKAFVYKALQNNLHFEKKN